MNKIFAFGLILMFASATSAQEYLIPTCQSILKNDLANTMIVADFDRDGAPNILLGTSVNGIIYNYIYKGADCTQEWTSLGNKGWSVNTGGDVKSIAVADFDGAGRNQIAVNMIKSSHPGSQNPNNYVKVLTVNGLDDWNFKDSCGYTHSLAATDVDGTGRPNVIMGTQSNSVCALKDNVRQKEAVLWSFANAKYPISLVKTQDIDGDGGIETVALSSKYLDAYVYALAKDGSEKWEKQIEGGVHVPMLASNVMDVADIDGDGKAETIVGTYKGGLKVIDSKGADKWGFATDKLVSSILVGDLNNDGSMEVLVGSAPKVVALDSTGATLWTWTAPTSNSIYSMFAADIDADGRKEVAVGTTKYIYILDHDGVLKGSWKYTVEIQGLTKAFEERDANAVAIYMGDLNGDGKTEVAAAWNWEQSTVRGNQYSLDLRVYSINKDYVPGQTNPAKGTTATTVASASANEDDAPARDNGEAATQEDAYSNAQEETQTEPVTPKKGMCSCMPALTAIIALGFAIVAKVPFAARNE